MLDGREMIRATSSGSSVATMVGKPHRSLVVVAGLLLCLFGCSKSKEQSNSRASAAAPACPMSLVGRSELQAAHAKRQLHLPTYWTTDAAWTDSDPLLVGREFDFSLALGLEVGVGIAAQKRRQAAESTAKQVSGFGALGLTSTVLAALGSAPDWCQRMRGRPVASYAMLFGDKDARLELVLDLRPSADAGTSSPITQLVAVSEAHPLEGPSSWLGDRGETLRQAIRSTAGTIARLAAAEPQLTAVPTEKVSVRCPIGGREAWRGVPPGSLDGSTLGPDQHVLVTSGPDTALVFCTEPLVAAQ